MKLIKLEIPLCQGNDNERTCWILILLKILISCTHKSEEASCHYKMCSLLES